MKCPHCNKAVSNKDNFCGFCGKKLKQECSCFVKKGTYNCRLDKCPGYGLYEIEKIKKAIEIHGIPTKALSFK